MSDPRATDPPADDEPLRFCLYDGRLRIDGNDMTIDVPLASIEQCTVNEASDQEVVDLRMCIDIRVSEFVMHHKATPSGLDAIRRAWRAAREGTRPDAPDSAAFPGADEEAVVEGPEPAAPTDVPPPICGPPLIADGPEWLMFTPLPDTRLLACGELLVHKESRRQ